MVLLYRLSISLYVFAIRLAAIRSHKAKLWIEGRKGWKKQLHATALSDGSVVWFHCASLGEFEQGRPVIEEMKKQDPSIRVLLTFFSPSGYEVRKKYAGADHVMYLPIDSPAHAKTFLDLVNPTMVVFVKYEFWYFYMHELKRRGIPTFLISAIFRKNQIFFKSIGKWYRKVLFWYQHIFVQDKNSASLLQSIGVGEVSVAGDTRFDRVAQIADAAKQLPIIEDFKKGRQMIVAGSTWPPDEELLARYMKSTSNEVCLVIAPHEIHASNISRLQRLFSGSVVLYSDSFAETAADAQVMVVDNIGLLSSMYRYGEIAYVGGAFKTGLHNVLEPACFSMPVLFGPEYSKFREAIGLVESGAGISILNYDELESHFNNLLINSSELDALSKVAGKYIQDNRGATLAIIEKTSNRLI